MTASTLSALTEQLELADQILAGRQGMFEPQDLPGRYGRVVIAVDHLLSALQCPSVLGGGWAVWRHGYVGRVTQDLDIALPANRIDDFLRTASVSGFELLPVQPGRWPKVLHRDTGIQVDILPEGARPGTEAKPAPTLIPHPQSMGAVGAALRYITLNSLIELKLAAGRARDESDVVELIRANPDQIDSIQRHLGGVHPSYVEKFEALAKRAQDEKER
jgi:hypothetical protein